MCDIDNRVWRNPSKTLIYKYFAKNKIVNEEEIMKLNGNINTLTDFFLCGG